MTKYRIAKDVELEKSHSLMASNAINTNLTKAGLLTIPFVGAPIAGAMILSELASKDVKTITSLEELDTFSCSESEWNKECIYIEHPIIPKRLIEARVYKDYILKELMAEIFDYITDNIAVKKIVLGLESKSVFEAGGTVPVDSLVSDATIKGSLNSNYVCTMEDIDCKNNDKKAYPWLKYYPDIVAGVKKNAGKMEIKQCVKMDLEVGVGVKGVLNGALKSDKEYNFYVYYIKA